MMQKEKYALSEKIRTYILIFSLGAVVYYVLEIMYRLRSHFTMVILGGICGIVIFRLNKNLKGEKIITKAFLCAVSITALEFASGIVLNILLGLKVWDYSDRLFNVMGQICPLFSLMWFLIAIPALYLCTIIEKNICPALRGGIFFRTK